jgi:hypothetical protein
MFLSKINTTLNNKKTSKFVRKDSNDLNNLIRPGNPMSKSFERIPSPEMISQKTYHGDSDLNMSNQHQHQAPAFYFGTGFDGTSKIVESKDDTNKGLNYIILQNDEFHQKHEVFLKEITELKNENEVLEDDNGRMESDKTRLRGLAINESEKNLKYKRVVLLYGSEISEKYKVNKNLNHMVLKMVLTIFVVQMVYLSVTSFVLSRKNNLVFAVPVIVGTFLTDVLVILAAEFLVKPIYNESSPFRNLQFWFFWHPDSMNANHVRLNEILREISEIEKGSGYLEQLIED